MVSGLKEVVFAGRSNVGKSTLFSTLLKTNARKGKRPGTTIKPNTFQIGRVLFTDLPGFGYVSGVGKDFNERIKDFVVHYIENNASRIIASVEVIDASSFVEIAERWERRGEIPIEIEMFEFLDEVTPKVFVAANKMDRVDDPRLLDKIVEKLGMQPPWQNWRHVIYPVSAKKGEVENLRRDLKQYLISMGLKDASKAFRGSSGRR
ncbi:MULTISPECIES: GTP-binding protein EngB [unclassified Archaeoglobus]|jgi:GTP-binding protein EngB required for normal cell division|uniref:GTP-binding protein EngB n=1 Tax=unclassified Archaeoglobus TaxID=2643606 RepID=UPI0025B99964|nr:MULTISPECIES: GTP-binding protein EngB [unclassified Archaeoglobus]